MRFILVFAGCVLLAACSEKKQPPVAAHSPLADSADQVMYGSRFVLADEGVSRAQMHSDTAYFFDDNTRMEFENPVVTFFTSTGAKDAVLTARQGTYNSRTSSMIARKNVVVVSEDGRRLTTPELLYSQQRNEISSDSAFLLTEANRQVSGIGFRSDPNMKNILILKGASGIARGVSTEATPTPPSATPSSGPSAPAPSVPNAASSTPPRP